MNEVEIKFHVADIATLEGQLKASGFRLQTQRTHEFNTIYDLPDHSLRGRGELLRLRKYGVTWTVTHKSKGAAGKHKSRKEIETKVEDGEQLATLFRSLGYVPTFRYEKFRTEWASEGGLVVIDETPIGIIAEIEGEAGWIDRTAKTLGVAESEYSTKSYAELYGEWKRNSGSDAAEMTWQAIGGILPVRS